MISSCALLGEEKNCELIYQGHIAGAYMYEYSCKQPPKDKKCYILKREDYDDYRCIVLRGR